MTEPLWGAVTTSPPPASVELPAAVDVAIVGGGYTGLWTALSLLRADPALDVLILEANHVGFGASGRNGGWVSALWPVSPERIASRHGRSAAAAQLAALRDTVDVVGAVSAEEGIDASFVKGGCLLVARGPAQALRARAYAAHSSEWGTETQWWETPRTLEHLNASGVDGSTFTPHCARIHPRRLADGLAAAVRRRGGLIAEGTAVRTAGPGWVGLADGRRARARHVVRATEAWTATLPGLRRRLAPVYSLMVATEPLPASVWARIGLAGREVFSDHGHVIIYGQRTADDRLAFGGRGAPYHFGSRIEPGFDGDEAVFAALRSTLTSLLPALGDVGFTHAWGGPLAIARDWQPAVGYDRQSQVGWAGGYVGDGVAATNLAGRTLADLILGRRTAITELPWVGHRSPLWEPEPFRWLGVNAGLRMAQAADAEESRRGEGARAAYLLDRLTGG